jgi:hypothetical protein
MKATELRELERNGAVLKKKDSGNKPKPKPKPKPNADVALLLAENKALSQIIAIEIRKGFEAIKPGKRIKKIRVERKEYQIMGYSVPMIDELPFEYEDV